MAAIYAIVNGNLADQLDVNQYREWLVNGSATVTSPMNVANTATFLTATANQWTVGYDASNKLVVNVSSAGAVSLTASGASAGFTVSHGVNVTTGGVNVKGTGNVDLQNSGQVRVYSNSDTPSYIYSYASNKSRGSFGTPTAVASGDTLGEYDFNGYNNGAYQNSTSIQGTVDAAPGATQVPGRLTFWTATAAAGPVERMRIDSAGNVSIGSAATPTNRLQVLSTTTPQVRYSYDGSNYLTTAVSSAGAVTYTATGASAGHTFANAVTVSTGGIAVTGNSSIILNATSALAFQILASDGTTDLYQVDTRTAVALLRAHRFSPVNPTVTSASGDTYNMVYLDAVTYTMTGTTTVTALDGMELYVNAPTITDGSSVIVSRTSTVYIAGAPTAGGGVTLSAPYALYVAAGATYLGGATTLTSTTANQWTVAYDASNRGVLNVSSAGACTWTAFGSGASFAFASPVSMSAARHQVAQGAVVASTNNLTLGTDGNLFRVSGTTQVNLIDSSSWQGGSIVTLRTSTGTVLVKHNQAPTGNFQTIILAGGVDYSMTQGSRLVLQYDVTALQWVEIGRALT